MRKSASYAVYYCPECDERIEIEYGTGYQPPAYRNRDDPRFSDPGDPGWIEYPDECSACGQDLSGYHKSINDAVLNDELQARDAREHYWEESRD